MSTQPDLSLNLGDNPQLHRLGSAQCIPNHLSTTVQQCIVEGSMFTSSKWALTVKGKPLVMGMVHSSIGTSVVDGPGMGIGEGDGEAEGAGP